MADRRSNLDVLRGGLLYSTIVAEVKASDHHVHLNQDTWFATGLGQPHEDLGRMDSAYTNMLNGGLPADNTFIARGFGIEMMGMGFRGEGAIVDYYRGVAIVSAVLAHHAAVIVELGTRSKQILGPIAQLLCGTFGVNGLGPNFSDAAAAPLITYPSPVLVGPANGKGYIPLEPNLLIQGKAGFMCRAELSEMATRTIPLSEWDNIKVALKCYFFGGWQEPVRP
jgi:hypothetical protein